MVFAADQQEDFNYFQNLLLLVYLLECTDIKQFKALEIHLKEVSHKLPLETA